MLTSLIWSQVVLINLNILAQKHTLTKVNIQRFKCNSIISDVYILAISDISAAQIMIRTTVSALVSMPDCEAL